MLNFNNAGKQKEFSGKGPIPPKSVVLVTMAIRQPGEKKRSTISPWLTVSSRDKNNHMLDCEFEVAAGTFQGVKIWQNFIVSGSEKAVNISMAFLRAVLESARGIQPTDASPAACGARQVNDWSDFNGLRFPVMVGVKEPAAGDQYINNDIMRAITPDKPEYQQVMAGGELVSSLPFPEIPGDSQPQQQPPAWGQQPPPPNQPPEPSVPAWGQPGATTHGQPQQQQLPGTGAKKPAWA